VKGGHHVFGSVRKRHDYSLLRPLYPVPVLLFVFFLAVQGLHSLLTALHRAGRLHQQGTMFHSGASGSATGYCLYHSLKFLIETLLVSIIYMIYMMYLSTLNKHTIIVTNIMIMSFFWIKLNLKLPNFLTFQKRDVRQFSFVGFAGLLKPTPFEGTHYKRWR
jgi:hypothetical protein